MTAPQVDRERRHIVAAARRYHELVWRDDGRIYAPFSLAVVVLFLVPGWWWAAIVALLLLAGTLLHIRVGRWIESALETECGTLQEARQMRSRMLLFVAVMVGLHALPNFALLFAPAPGPAMALLLSMMTLMLLANMQIMTRSMIFMTAIVPALTAAIAAAHLATGWAGVVLGFLLAGGLFQAAMLVGPASDAFNQVVAARLDDEDARDLLEQRVAERTIELREAVSEAERANKAKSLFLANMSHELRTPLNAVIGYSELIEEDLESGDVSECPHHIARVRGAGKHLLGLIADILDVAKADAERIALEPEEIDAPALARSVLDTIAPAAAKNNTACDVLIEPGVGSFVADALRVRQCLLNLASNAAKFTQDGRIILRVHTQTYEGAEALAFEFADTGIGISEDVQANLFEPFVQADASVTRAYGGSGLGLSITRRLARIMGGDVTLQSKLGEGSRFTLILPKMAPVADAAKSEAA